MDADALVREHGRTFADELEIDVGRDKPLPLFELLVASLLLASRIQHRLAIQAARELRSSGLRTARDLAEADRQRIGDTLTRGKYLRVWRTTDLLQGMSHECLDRYGGDLRGLRSDADGDADRLRELLQDFKGIGETGAEVFAREVQVAWTEFAPFYGSRALEAAKRLGIAQRDLPGLGDPATVGAALIRSSLTDG
jgi:endonuclease III